MESAIPASGIANLIYEMAAGYSDGWGADAHLSVLRCCSPTMRGDNNVTVSKQFYLPKSSYALYIF
ncbi:hypothetical protein H8E77_22150 [bacterium]|nr:hypothetical protein [bacterium]